MKAMVFAAGIGSRLKELTQHTPKCLIPVGKKTMLEHVIDRLKGAGVTKIAINVHHHAKQVTDFIGAHNDFGLEVITSYEPTLLDTGGGLKKLANFFAGEEAFLIHNADIFSEINLGELVAQHHALNAIATLAVMERTSKRGLYFDSTNRLIGWTGADTPTNAGQLFSFCGVSIASHQLFSFMEDEDVFSIIKTFLAAARSTGRVWGSLISDPHWTDIGTPETLQKLRERLGVSCLPSKSE